jgi:NADPH-dependent 2,4-dienoyl-CoA reductase/sulfur reductase-like enzyme
MIESVAVVGASLAGIRTVEALRRQGFKGRISVIGAEDEPPYDRPPLSKQFLVDDWPDEKLALCRDGLEGLEADWHLGVRAESLDIDARRVHLEGGESVSADAIVIATGTQARRLPFGRELEGVLELRTVEDARRLRKALSTASRAVIVGAGFIGMEVAASCRKRGLEVAVVEPLEAPLMRGLGPILGERVARTHREHGVAFHLGVGVDGFEGEGAVRGVRLSNGEVLAAELVVVGVGAAPATAWLESSGLEIDNGVLCDATGSAGVEGIYAVGDCARWENPRYPERPRFEHWTSAVEQSEVVAQALVKGEAEDFAPIPYVWSDQFDLRIAIVGELRPGDEMHVCQGKLEDDRFLALFGRDGKLVAAVGFKRPRPLNASRKRIAEGATFAAAIAEFDETER